MDVIKEMIENKVEPEFVDLDRYSAVLKVKLELILEDLVHDCSEIMAAMVSGVDGRAWAERGKGELDENRFAAMSSSLLALSDTLIKEIHQGKVKKVLIESEGGNIFVVHAGTSLLLTIITHEKANIGMPLAHANRVAEEIGVLVQQCVS
jgi:predicted regulator of Ras-like GTPase activity (Roadblock/LC7/MglB family)